MGIPTKSILSIMQGARTILSQAAIATPQIASIANTVISAQLQAIANVTTQIQNITNVSARVVTFATNDNSNTIIRSIGEANLVHGIRPTANTKGVNGQMWYHPDGNLYVCVDAYTANAYYRWQRIQLVNL